MRVRTVFQRLCILPLALALSCGGEGAPSGSSPSVTALEIVPANPTADVGATLTMTAVVRDQNGAVMAGQTVAWTSSIPSVAKIGTTTGVVTVLAPGATTLAASAGGKVATTVLVVAQPVASLFIDSIAPKLYVGRSAQLVFEVRDALAKPVLGRSVAWTSSAPGVATISSTGVLTGVSAGNTQITGTVDGKSATRVIVVQAIPSAVIAVSPELATLARGADYALVARITDVDGNVITGHPVTYTTSDPTIATVSPAGVVHPIANGSVTISAVVDGTIEAPSRITVLDPRTVQGLAATADGGKPSNLVFVARWGTGVTAERMSAPIDANTGAFALVMPAFGVNGPAIEYFVDVASGTARAYHPSYVKMAAGATLPSPRIVLVPHVVVPDSGTYKGIPYTVDLNEAFTPVCTNTTDANCQSYWPSYWVTGIKNWPDAARPVPLAIDRTTGPVSSNDSTTMWAIIRTMEADLGRSLYRPAMFTTASNGFTNGMVLASFDPTLTGFAGYTNWNWDGSGALIAAKMRLAGSQYFSASSIVSHELTHALGFSHTCRWQTIMGGYGCAQQQRLGVMDVAYYHLAEMVRRKTASIGANWSVAESLAGVRVLELGIVSADAIPAGLRAALTKIGQPGSDASP